MLPRAAGLDFGDQLVARPDADTVIVLQLRTDFSFAGQASRGDEVVVFDLVVERSTRAVVSGGQVRVDACNIGLVSPRCSGVAITWADGTAMSWSQVGFDLTPPPER